MQEYIDFLLDEEGKLLVQSIDLPEFPCHEVLVALPLLIEDLFDRQELMRLLGGGGDDIGGSQPVLSFH